MALIASPCLAQDIRDISNSAGVSTTSSLSAGTDRQGFHRDTEPSHGLKVPKGEGGGRSAGEVHARIREVDSKIQSKTQLLKHERDSVAATPAPGRLRGGAMAPMMVSPLVVPKARGAESRAKQAAIAKEVEALIAEKRQLQMELNNEPGLHVPKGTGR